MARIKKYQNEAERKAAQKARAKAYYQKNKDKMVEATDNWIKAQGFESQKDYRRTTPSYTSRLVKSEPNKFKTKYTELPEGCHPIPNMPTYYITKDAKIYRWSEKRQYYLEISQQQQKYGYVVFQPYINGKRCVRFVHITMCETFISPRPHPNHQVDHIDMQRDNNKITNLRWLTRADNLKRRQSWAKK